MTIHLTPEDEILIQKRLKSGAFESVEQIIHEALAAQDAEADWLSENKDLVRSKIARGVAQLDRGEGSPGEVVRERLRQRKANWAENQPR